MKRAKLPKLPVPSEHESQVALFERIAMHPATRGLPIFAIPNGGHRHKAVAAKLKAEGVKSGVPDVFAAVARRGFHGAFIEMKKKGNTPTPAQVAWLDALRDQNYWCGVCYSADDAFSMLTGYLNG